MRLVDLFFVDVTLIVVLTASYCCIIVYCGGVFSTWGLIACFPDGFYDVGYL